MLAHVITPYLHFFGMMTLMATLLKAEMFLRVALSSIFPTVPFLSWRKMLEQDQMPAVDTQRATRLRSGVIVKSCVCRVQAAACSPYRRSWQTVPLIPFGK